MSFNSLQFVVFFPIVVLAHFALPPRFRWAWLLAASYYFYMSWKPAYGALMLFTTAIDFYAALRMSAARGPGGRRFYLVLSLVSNLAMLGAFKYFNFFGDSLSAAFRAFGVSVPAPTLHVLLPIGISFYTFQSLSYTIDVYRGARPAERHFGYFALYVSFFPQLVSGPIERSTHLLPQLWVRETFDWTRAADGLRLMLWGFFKKLVVADRLSVYVDQVYGHPGLYHGGPVWLATYFFAFQIYCDFSGYTDIAIGAAQVFGVRLINNFDRPYWADSVREFWRRWHISLSTWFRDYLYIPLGGNRVSRWRWPFNILVTFLLAGLWHGASWTFVIWGGLHGACMILGQWAEPLARAASRLPGRWPAVVRAARIALTFHLVCFAWIFFRAASLPDALALIGRLFVFGPERQALAAVALGPAGLLVSVAAIAVVEAVQLTRTPDAMRALFVGRPAWQRWAVCYALLLAILLLHMPLTRPFVYFQF